LSTSTKTKPSHSAEIAMPAHLFAATTFCNSQPTFHSLHSSQRAANLELTVGGCGCGWLGVLEMYDATFNLRP